MRQLRQPFLVVGGILLHAAMIMITMPTFVRVNHLRAEWPLMLFVLVAIVCVLPWRLGRRWWPLTFLTLPLAMIGIVYALFPGRGGITVAWAEQTINRLSDSIASYLGATAATVPSLLSLVLILLAIAALTILYVRYDIWLVTALALVAYLVAVNVFNGDDLTTTVMLLMTVASVLAVVRQLMADRPRWPVTIAGVVTALAAVGLMQLAANQNTYLANVTAPLVNNTTALRDRLNTAGFFQSLERFGAGSARTGFSENDTTLGGPLFDDNSVVFTAVDYEDHYWRVETKDDYTGKGWETSMLTDYERLRGLPAQLPIAGMTSKTAATKHNLSMTFTDASDFVPLPYGAITLNSVDRQTTNVFVGWAGNRNRLFTGGRSRSFAAVNRITATYEKYNYTTSQLVNAPNPTIDQGTSAFSRDLELPRSVTKRTKDLAARIVRNKTTYYSQVTAISDYLRDNMDLLYSKVDTPRTPSGRDYVDYFLFDSKTGYCDNYSTAMIVMLRSLGIPARWAKGFNGGNPVGIASGGRSQYQILNSAAHSWPEVYFTDIGWVPFEPTPGFTNPDERKQTANESDTPSTSSSSTASSASSSSNTSSVSRSVSQAARSSVSSTSDTTTTTNDYSGWLIAGIAAGVAALSAGFLFWQRRRVLILWTSWRLRHLTNGDLARVFRLFDRVATTFLTRPVGETITAYYQRFTTTYDLPPDSLTGLVENVNDLLYSGQNGAKQMMDQSTLEKLQQVLRILQTSLRTKKGK
ncbi:transglutaminase domain-containing protein [Schleiferilactobacillus perolens]|jgi:transglutaminase-like putative cysteine protease|uniref:transglutaminase family protein n=1 Tax=Schleiferilactobacillus perolens TaxID=100468 RepID=UPI002354C21A|nr:transglutaminase domain-containing protein [Schleiferilactobacillus perolens]MCI2172413.1 DUF3488 and transglutaminase-like domain-containing protein [Schleiferilactobacillus perolens]